MTRVSDGLTFCNAQSVFRNPLALVIENGREYRHEQKELKYFMNVEIGGVGDFLYPQYVLSVMMGSGHPECGC
jgi:hypothetical protein